MAIYTTTHDTDIGVTRIVVEGDIQLDELKAYAESADFVARCSKICCDLTASTVSSVSTEQLIQSTRKVRHLNHPGNKGAFVVSKSVNVGMLNIFKAYTEQLQYDATLEIFTEFDKAMTWLQQSQS